MNFLHSCQSALNAACLLLTLRSLGTITNGELAEVSFWRKTKYDAKITIHVNAIP